MSQKGPFMLFRVFGLLLVLALIIGAGAFGYRAGVQQGITQSPQVAKAMEKAWDEGQPAAYPPMYGYRYAPYGYATHHPHGFFPVGLICGSLFFLFFLFGFMKMMFFRRMAWARHGGHHHHSHPWMRHGCDEPRQDEKREEKKDEAPKTE